jgi:hypothetical protein
VAALSKAWVRGRFLAAIAGSNLAEVMDMFLLSTVCCQIEVSASG